MPGGQLIPAPAGRWIILPGVILPVEAVARLNTVCTHSGRTRDAVVRLAVESFVDGYLDGCGLAE